MNPPIHANPRSQPQTAFVSKSKDQNFTTNDNLTGPGSKGNKENKAEGDNKVSPTSKSPPREDQFRHNQAKKGTRYSPEPVPHVSKLYS